MSAATIPQSLEQQATNRQSDSARVPADLKALLLNRELSWIEFNRRVLEEALDAGQPLLERLKFLGIFSTNLDEFFMIRVSGLKQQSEEEVVERSPDGMTPREQLQEISARLRPIVAAQMDCFQNDILPRLQRHGVLLTSYSSLSDTEKRELRSYFMDNIFPVLTPQAVDPSHPFPYISNRSLNIGLMVGAPELFDRNLFPGMRHEPRFARVKVPPLVSRLVPVGSSGTKYTYLEELIAANIECLFPGMKSFQCYPFRVTRDADIEIREDEAGDLLRVMEQKLRRRRFGTAIRLEVSSSMPAEMTNYLMASLKLVPEEVYVIAGPLNLPDFMELYQLDLPDLKDKPLLPAMPPQLKRGQSVFDVIKRRDILLHHPYTSYSAVTDFITSAARDNQVLAIKICLYRTGQNSPIVQALMDAAEKGKQVAALVELKARFDEENNIEWARRLERAGVHVVYGLLGLKTHCKVALVVRREDGSLKRYVHLATGNYNPTTSRIYTDLSLFTANEEIAMDAAELFNYLTGYSLQSEYRRLLVAPVILRKRISALIRREIAHKEGGRPSGILVKINSLTDIGIIRELYEASQAGVKIDLIIRGICTLRPGVAGISETITVRSIVGRFLEHSRIFYFVNGGEPDVYIGSADWMSRNLDRRVELVIPIDNSDFKKYLKDVVLESYLRDTEKARLLRSDGSYQRIQPLHDYEAFSSQDFFASREQAGFTRNPGRVVQ